MYNAFKYTKLLAVVVVLSALCRSCTAAEESSGTGIKLSTSAQLVLAVCLICFSALFAGLTLGIMGCDTTTLEIIADSGDEPDKTYAKAILPVRRLGHQSLCTLVLGNMFANVMIAELCTDVDPEGGSGGSGFAAFLAFVVSTLLILIFTEILPASVCKSEKSLQIASKGVPILRVFIVLLYPIAKPLGMLLDRIISHGPRQLYDRNELKRLMILHGATHGERSGIDDSEVTLMIGTMEFHELCAVDIMISLDRLYMLDSETIIDKQTILKLWTVGHSRVPVFRSRREIIVGTLYLKDLVLWSTPVRAMDFVTQNGRDRVFGVSEKLKLPVLLKLFQTGRAHMAVVEGSDGRGAKGVVTLEAIKERLIRAATLTEIERTSRSGPKVNFFSFSMEDEGGKIRGWQMLYSGQAAAIASFLQNTIGAFTYQPLEKIELLLSRVGTINLIPPTAATQPQPEERDPKKGPKGAAAHDQFVDGVPQELVLYRINEQSAVFTLVLSGCVEMLIGEEGFRKELRTFGYVADAALQGPFTASYSVKVAAPSKLLRITKQQYDEAFAARTSEGSRDGALNDPLPAK